MPLAGVHWGFHTPKPLWDIWGFGERMRWKVGRFRRICTKVQPNLRHRDVVPSLCPWR